MSAESTGNSNSIAIRPAKLSHAVLRTGHLDKMIEWYKTVFNGEVLFENDFIAFMTYDDEHHRIAFIGFPGVVDKPKGSAGLDHLAFFYATLGDWIATYERLKTAGITPRIGIHHGLTMSLYYRDPDNNGVELAIDNVEKSKWHDWMRNTLKDVLIGAPIDPEELVRKYHAGVPEAELRRFTPASELDPEVLRRMVE